MYTYIIVPFTDLILWSQNILTCVPFFAEMQQQIRSRKKREGHTVGELARHGIIIQCKVQREGKTKTHTFS